MAEEQHENSKVPERLQPHVFKKGQSGNPNGRPLGSVSLKQYAKKMLEEMNNEQRQEYLEGLPKDFIWKMAEGNPETDVGDNTVEALKILFDPSLKGEE